MNSKLMWGLVVTFACASAVRRGGKSEELSVAAGLEHIQSLLEKHTGSKKAKKSAEMLRSLQQMAATPGVLGNMSKAVERLQQDVVDKILRDSKATQAKIVESVAHFDTAANDTQVKKGIADADDQGWDVCVGKEKDVMEQIVQLQGTYNQKTVATVAPCQKEIDTESFTHTSEALTVSCNLVEDPDCAVAFAAFEDSVSGIESTMEREVNTSVKLHTDAEDDCDAANASQILAKANLGSKQGVWEHNHSDCIQKGTTRDSAICHYGEKLQIACEKKSTYDELIGEVTGTENPMSVSDRKDELEVGELVICLLHNFVKGGNVTEEIINSCSSSATAKLSELDLDLQDSEVKTIIQTNTIKCESGIQISFFGSKWESPMPANQELPEPPQFDQILPLPIPTFENSSLPEYVVKSPWTLTYASTGDPFNVC